jgi:hypothetical protein
MSAVITKPAPYQPVAHSCEYAPPVALFRPSYVERGSSFDWDNRGSFNKEVLTGSGKNYCKSYQYYVNRIDFIASLQLMIKMKPQYRP